MVWRPLHPQHAIERTRVTIAFDQPILEKPANKAAASFQARSSGLQFGPRVGASEAFLGLPMAGLGLVPPPTALSPFVGWAFSRFSPEGRQLEVFGLFGPELIYDAFEYGRWALMRERLEKVLDDIPGFLAETFNHRTTALEYQNRFIFAGEPTAANVRELIGGLASALPEHAAAGEKPWHLHRGWFQSEGPRDVLVNQNMDVQDGQLAQNQPARSLSITTRAELSYTHEEDGIEGLYSDLDLLHDVASREFARPLLPDVRKMVGLE